MRPPPGRQVQDLDPESTQRVASNSRHTGGVRGGSWVGTRTSIFSLSKAPTIAVTQGDHRCGRSPEVSGAALRNLQTGLCRELAPYRIRVNGVAPGFVATSLNAAISDEERANVLAQIPMGRAGSPDDVTDAVEFLVGPRSAYLTGAVIDVNGGWLPA